MEKKMAISKLTTRRIRSAKSKRHSYIIFDKKLKGFGLRVDPSGRKTFIIRFMRNGTSHREMISDNTDLPVKEARAIARTRINALTALQEATGETPFEDFAELAMARMTRLWKPSTIKVNRYYLHSAILPCFKGQKIGDISNSDVRDWFAGLQHKPGTANRASPVLSVIMAEAEEMGARPQGSNPVKGVRRYRMPKMERVLTAKEMARLGAALEARKVKYPLETAFITLVVLTGCRKGELQSLNWRDYRDGHLYLPDSKTGPKTIFLSSNARRVLDGIETKRCGLVFPQPRNGTGGLNIELYWYGLRREIGLEDVRIHDLRHNYASVAVRLGENLTVIGTLLGHKKLDTTLRYAHLNDGMMVDAVARVGEAMTRKQGEGK